MRQQDFLWHRSAGAVTATELDAMLLVLLDRAFKGEI